MSVEPSQLLRFLHLFFSFIYVGSLVLVEWNGREARRNNDWGTRAVLFRLMYVSSLTAGMGGLILTGAFGNMLAVFSGYDMAHTPWLHAANGLWLLAGLILGFVGIPGAASLARIAREMAAAAEPRKEPLREYSRVLTRWRIGNVAQSVLYVVLLMVMVFRWGS
jgi:uncharacterized membrane protein